MPRRILVVKLADLGDLLTATPALRALRLTFPDAAIDALVTPGSSPALAGSTAVNRTIGFDKFAFDRPTRALASLPAALRLGRSLRAARYDALVLLHHLTTAYGTLKYAALALAAGAPTRAGLDNGRGWFLTHRAADAGFGERHEADYWLEVAATLGARNPSPRLELPTTENDLAQAERRWRDLGLDDRPTAVLHPGSGGFSLARRWPAERFALLADRLIQDHGLQVAILAGPGPSELELAERVLGAMHHRGRLLHGLPSVQQLAATLRLAAIVVGNDSGVIHVAAAEGRPVVAIFGPTNHRAWGPYPPTSPRHAVVREPLACSPCIHRGHAFGTPAGCPARTCLEIVEVETVLAAADRLLQPASPTPSTGPHASPDQVRSPAVPSAG